MALTAILGCSPLGASGRCGECPADTACLTLGETSGFHLGDAAISACSIQCGRDAQCGALGATAYCTVYDRCAIPCGPEAACARGACHDGVCGVRGADDDAPPSRGLGSPLAVGGVTHVWSSGLCEDGVAVSSDPAVVEVLSLDLERCAARIRAHAPGTATVELPTAEGSELHTIEVSAVEYLTIGRLGSFLWSGDLVAVDLQHASASDETLTVIARDASDRRLVVGMAGEWSLDDPSLGSIVRNDDFDTDYGIARIAALADGTTIVRVRLGDRERAIPIEIRAP